MNFLRPETLALAGVFALLFLAEWLVPLRSRKAPALRRFALNAFLTALAFLAGYFAVRSGARAAIAWSSDASFGLLRLIPSPAWLHVALGFLLMDLTFYYWHRANHRFPLLWRFHNVHHIDPDLDVTTSFRFHVGEIVYSTAFRVLQVTVIGVSVTTYAIYEFVFQCGTMLHHSNVRLPIRVERLLNRVIVTPRMHGIHHSVVKNETNSNYSVVFRWWDRMHRTLRLAVPQQHVRIGVPGYLEPADNTARRALLAPFQRQKDYWRFADGSQPVRVPPPETPERNLLAE